MILNPVTDLVMQGTPPVRAPDFFVWPSSLSRYRKLLMIVDFPTFGTPPIMSHDPTVLNCGLAFVLIKLKSLFMLTFCFVDKWKKGTFDSSCSFLITSSAYFSGTKSTLL